MTNDIQEFIASRASASRLKPGMTLPRSTVQRLIDLAGRAPSSFNLQNWRFVVADTEDAKSRLRAVAGDQVKVTDAAAVVIVVGSTPDADRLHSELAKAVEEGVLPDGVADSWSSLARAMYDGNPELSRDEAVRSASLAAATLIFAAGAEGLATCPMVGFDPAGVAREFGLAADEVPVMLVAIGRPSEGNWPQKPRRPVSENLEFA